MKYLIWSIEHNAWWKSNSYGYTYHKAEAGRYTLEEATQICLNANFNTGNPNEAMVPVPE